MRFLLLIVVSLVAVQAAIYDRKSRQARFPDEFDNLYQPNGPGENNNPNEVVSIDGEDPNRVYHTQCGVTLREITVLNPVNSDRDEYMLKRILIEKDTNKPASGPCVEALQATLDKEDALKPTFFLKRRSPGGVEPILQGVRPEPEREREDPADRPNPHIFHPHSHPHSHHPHHPQPNYTYPQQQPRDDRPSDYYNGPYYKNRPRNGKNCAYNPPTHPQTRPPVVEPVRRRECNRNVMPWCDMNRPWLNTQPCLTPPPPPATTTKYEEIYRPPVEWIPPPPPRIEPVRRSGKCIHRQQTLPPPPETQPPLPQVRPRGGRCQDRRNRLRLEQPDRPHPHHHHGHEHLKPLPIAEEPRRDEPLNLHHRHPHHRQELPQELPLPRHHHHDDENENDDERKKREPIAALPVYRF